MNEKKKPQTDREWALYRARASCNVGNESIKKGDDRMGMYCLIKAVEDIARAMEMDVRENNKTKETK